MTHLSLFVHTATGKASPQDVISQWPLVYANHSTCSQCSYKAKSHRAYSLLIMRPEASCPGLILIAASGLCSVEVTVVSSVFIVFVVLTRLNGRRIVRIAFLAGHHMVCSIRSAFPMSCSHRLSLSSSLPSHSLSACGYSAGHGGRNTTPSDIRLVPTFLCEFLMGSEARRGVTERGGEELE